MNEACKEQHGCLTADGDEIGKSFFTVSNTIWQSIQDKTFDVKFCQKIRIEFPASDRFPCGNGLTVYDRPYFGLGIGYHFFSH